MTSKTLNRKLVYSSAALATVLSLAGDAWAYQFVNPPRWNSDSTASPQDSGGSTQGNPVRLTWSIVPDGSDIYEALGEPNNASSLISFMDANFGGTGASLADRPWFHIYASSYGRWAQLAGITMVFEPNDDGAPHPFDNGVLGVRGDLRIAGHAIPETGSGITLAYNYFPDYGDMVVNTGALSFFTDSTNDYRLIRNTLMHEIGHGLGIDHLDSSNSTQLMEPFLNTSIDGPQHDDIRSAQRQYGDTFEKGLGNDTAATATALGIVGDGSTVSIGRDADNPTVARTDADFISIDDDSDVDYLSFTIAAASEVSLLLKPLGLTYDEGPQGGAQTSVNTAQISDLTLELYDTNGSSLLASSNLVGVGLSELIGSLQLDAGTYFARISGSANDLQFYQLDVSAVAVPEPTTLGILSAGLAGLVRRRRHV